MTERWEIIWCPICGKEVYRHDPSPVSGRARISSRSPRGGDVLTQMIAEADAIHRSRIEAAEKACNDHFRTRHGVRLRLWKRLRWSWLMNGRWPWSRPADFERFGVKVR